MTSMGNDWGCQMPADSRRYRTTLKVEHQKQEKGEIVSGNIFLDDSLWQNKTLIHNVSKRDYLSSCAGGETMPPSTQYGYGFGAFGGGIWFEGYYYFRSYLHLPCPILIRHSSTTHVCDSPWHCGVRCREKCARTPWILFSSLQASTFEYWTVWASYWTRRKK